jgi:hypothetical protein
MNEIPMKADVPSMQSIDPDANDVVALPTTRLKCPKCGYGEKDPDEKINQRPPIPNDPKGECECPKCKFRWVTSMDRTDDKMKVLKNDINEDFKMVIFKSPDILLSIKKEPKFSKKLTEMLESIEPMYFELDSLNYDSMINVVRQLMAKDRELTQPTSFTVVVNASPDLKANVLIAELLKSLRERIFKNFKKNITAIKGTMDQYKQTQASAANSFASGVTWIDSSTGERYGSLGQVPRTRI